MKKLTKKKIMREFKMDEISSVDNPAQKGARMTIMKRDAEETGETLPDNETKEKTKMTAKTVEELTAEIAKVAKALEDEKAKVAKADAIAKMNDAEKAHFNKMDETAKTTWLSKTETDRTKIMTDLAKADETLVVGGETISKRAVGDVQFAMFKRLSDAETRIAKAEEAAALATFEKRASVEFANLPGTDVEKAVILKAVSGLDEAVAKNIETLLKAANDANKAAFEKKGVNKGLAEDSPEGKLEKAAKEFRKADPKLTEAQAYVKALEANPELYNEAN